MEELIEVLGQELETFNRFLILLDEQHKKIVSRDLAGLAAVNSEFDMLNLKAHRLEKKRQAIVEAISEMTGDRSTKTTLAAMLPGIDELSGKQLKELRQAIIGANRQIEEKSTRNKNLIAKSRQLIAESMKIIAGRPSPVYQRPQPVNNQRRDRSLINRSA